MRRVRIALNNPPESFRFGSTITARLSNGQSPVLRVPASAVLKEGAETFVWVVDAPKSTVSLHRVDLSEEEAGIRINGGLSIGERIATAGVHSLKQGQHEPASRPIGETADRDPPAIAYGCPLLRYD